MAAEFVAGVVVSLVVAVVFWPTVVYLLKKAIDG